MANVQKQFEKFHETIRTDYETNKELREKRDIILDKIEQSLVDAKRPRFRRLMQGSYIMRTGVMPAGDKEYDIDVGLHFNVKEKDYSAADVRSWVLDAIENHTKNVESKGPCVRVRYVKGFHVDLVAYATWTDDDGKEQCRLAHETKGWIAADPMKLIAFVSDAQTQFADTEGGTQTTQLRRVIRALKRWDDVCLPDESEAKPSGLAFTLFAIHHLAKTTRFDGTPDDRAALATLATYTAGIARLSEAKPTPEYEDMFARLDAKNMAALLKRFATMNTALGDADKEPDPVKACALLRAVFGDDFPIPPPDETGEKVEGAGNYHIERLWVTVTDFVEPRVAAEQELVRLGFARTGDTWLSTSDVVTLRVELPTAFPFELPRISVDRRSLGARIAHVERSGKICIAANAGVMLDPNQPVGLVRESITRARLVVSDGLSGTNATDLFEEFNAYWPSVVTGLISLCEVEGKPRRIALGALKDPRPGVDLVAAETQQLLFQFAERTGIALGDTTEAYLVPLHTPVTPPDFEEQSDLAYAISLVRKHATAEHRRIIGRWMYANNSRLTLVFSFRWSGEFGAACFALRLREPLPATAPGFRPAHVPFSAVGATYGLRHADRLVTHRADPTFLRARTGSSMDLSNKSVMVIGCGAIGGYLAACLAEAGVGALTLVDADTLKAENAMRHLLGLSEIGRSKVSALKIHLQRKLPQIDIDVHAKVIDEVLSDDPDIAARQDVVVLATGDHTLELRLNRLLRDRARLVHVWLEAGGVGGHAFVDGHRQKGCFECLFATDDLVGFHCRASLCAAGQSFTSSIGGCAGTFTPFGSMDAQRAAIEAARVTIRVLLNDTADSLLVTWYQSSAPFDAGSLKPSLRARQLTPGTQTEVTSHAGCAACAS